MRAVVSIKLAALLLLALLAPLQSVLAVACAPAPQAHASCPDHPQHDQGGATQHLCGCCCVVAMDTIAFRFDVPRDRAAPLTLPAPHAPRELARDRLDRPPR